MKQNDSQKDTFPSSLSFRFTYFAQNFYMAMAGACMSIPRKAQQLSRPNGTQTTYSWPKADNKKTTKPAVSLEKPFFSNGVQQCLKKKKWIGKFQVFQYYSKLLQFHQSE